MATKKLTVPEMLENLKTRFPGILAVDNSEFTKSAQVGTGIWVKNAESITYTAKDSNTLYCSLMDSKWSHRLYEFEIYKKFDAYCHRFGFYASTENYVIQLFKL